MRFNIALLVGFVFLRKFIGNSDFLDASLLRYVVVFVIGTIAILDLFHSRPKLLAMTAWIGTGALVLFAVIVPMIGMMSLRQAGGPAVAVHDDPIQQEEAVKFLLQGKNPYVEDYTQTPLADWSGGTIFGMQNPALFHVIALPGHIILSTILQVPLHAVFGFFDERFLYLLAYFVSLFVVSRIGRTGAEKLRWVILIGLNPLIVPYLVDGRNDILVFSLLATAWLLFQRNRRRWGIAIFALACCVKLFAWLFLPFVVAMLIGRARGASLWQRFRSLLPEAGIFAGITTLIILPFLIWNPSAFIDDIIRYANGTSVTSYPINGIGWSSFLVMFGVVKNTTDYYPFWIGQAIVTIPLLVLLLPRLIKRPSVGLMVISGTFTLVVFVWFARFFNDNYVGLFALLGITGLALLTEEQPVQPRAPDSV